MQIKSENLVFKGQNDQALTNSLLVAEKFEKEHKNILRDIQNLTAQNRAAKSLFIEDEYERRGKIYPMYIMNRDGFSLLVMGFTGRKALGFKMEFLNAFNKMERMLKSDDYILARSQEILQKRLQSMNQQLQMAESERDHYQAEVKILAPKADYTDTVLQSTSTYTMTQVAKEFGMSAHRFGNLLRERKVMFYQSGQWLLTSKYQAKGYTKPRTHHYTSKDGSTGTNTITVWTEKGRAFLHNKLGEEVLS